MQLQLADRHAIASALMGDDARLPIPYSAFRFAFWLAIASVVAGGFVGLAVSAQAGVVAAVALFAVAQLLSLGFSIANQNARIRLAVERIAQAPTTDIACSLTSDRFAGSARNFAFEELARREAMVCADGAVHATHS